MYSLLLLQLCSIAVQAIHVHVMTEHSHKLPPAVEQTRISSSNPTRSAAVTEGGSSQQDQSIHRSGKHSGNLPDDVKKA